MWSMILAARFTAPSILCNLDKVFSSVIFPFFSETSRFALAREITFSGWFNSWAMPVDISPNVANFADCNNLASAIFCLVKSVTITQKPDT